jgi:hypothetical protein
MTMSHANLSNRGELFASPAYRQSLLDILSDSWHPETNSSGYISLGVAENVATNAVEQGQSSC